MNAVLTVATKEFRDGLRNRWVLAITVVFALFAVGLAWFGAAAAGHVGFTGVATTVISLATLAVFLIPLIALMLAYDSIVGEDQQGTLLLLLTYPLSRSQLITGKFLGHGAILGLSTLVGFGVAGAVIGVLGEGVNTGQLVMGFGLFIASALLLGWAFIGLAYLISVVVGDKAKAAGLALVVWFLFVLVYDLVLLALLVGTEGGVPGGVFQALLLFNPTDVFRLINLTGFEAAREYAGLASIAGDAYSLTTMFLVLAAWAVAPFLLALCLFRRRTA